jgi:hypothetical protein
MQCGALYRRESKISNLGRIRGFHAALQPGGGDESLPVHKTNESSLKVERRIVVKMADRAVEYASEVELNLTPQSRQFGESRYPKTKLARFWKI